MIATDSAPVFRPHRAAKLCLSLFAIVLLLASCSDSAEPLPDQVTAQLDIANNAIADLTADGGDDVPGERASPLDCPSPDRRHHIAGDRCRPRRRCRFGQVCC